MGTTSDKLTYLNETKTLLKNKINITGANITTDTFRQYPTKLQNALLNIWNNEGEPIFTNWGTKVNGEGTNVKLDNTLNARMKITPKGNTTQTGTPTPSSPIPVNVVSGDNEVVVCGKNLLNLNNVSGTSNSVAYSVNSNGELKLNGTLSSDRIEIPLGISIPLNGTYTYSKNASTGTITLKNSSYTNLFSIGGSAGNQTATVNDNITQIVIYATNGNVYNNSTIQLQIEKGSTPTTYEAYTGNNYPIYLGVENLINTTLTTQTLNGVQITRNNDGSYTLNGTTNANTNFIWFQGSLTLPAGKYYIGLVSTSENMNLYLTNGGNTIIHQPINVPYDTLELNSSKTYNGLKSYATTGKTFNNETFYPMISTKPFSSYTPYGTTPIELNKIGTYQDYIYKTDKWYLHKEVGKVVLNGSESWSKSTTSDSKYRYYVENFLYAVVDTGLCSHYSLGIFSQRNNAGQTGKFFIGGTNSLQFVNDISAVADFKTWLSTNQPIVYYVLATPTNTEITNTTLINQLEQLKGAMSYEGQTNISSGFMIVGASALGELE